MTNFKVLSSTAIQRRANWISEIVTISGNFGQDYTRVEAELSAEVAADGSTALLDHLRLAGVIPESYRHDSSEEKLYSKYTDALLALTFRYLGLESIVLTERADAADVEVFADGYEFVADAKAFRLSRTAKNQKDFKVQAMDGWRRGKKYAIVIAPLYQLPASSSQIYQQAITRDVCLLSYSHLVLLVRIADTIGTIAAKELLTVVLSAVATMTPTKDAATYWEAINRAFLEYDNQVAALWEQEKIANRESIIVAKVEGLEYLAVHREQIMLLAHEEALRELITMNKIDNKASALNKVTDNGLLNQ